MHEFEVGDLVIGTPNNGYSMTNDERIMYIISIDSDRDYFKVKVCGNNGSWFDDEYEVKCCCFITLTDWLIRQGGMETMTNRFNLLDNANAVRSIAGDIQEAYCKNGGTVIYPKYMIEPEYIHSYHGCSKSYEALATEEERTIPNSETLYYGFELEVNSNKDINLNGCAKEIRDILGMYLFDIQRDSSVSNGFEIITQPMTYGVIGSKPFQKVMRSLFSYLEKSDLIYNKGCGMHIHVSKEPLRKVDKYYGKLLSIVEGYKDEFKKLSRRDEFGYCYFVSDQNGRDIKIDPNTLEKVYYDKDRHSVINNYGTNTVEFRLWKGVTDIDTFNSCIDIWNKMVISVINGSYVNKNLSYFVHGKSAKALARKQQVDVKIKNTLVCKMSKHEAETLQTLQSLHGELRAICEAYIKDSGFSMTREYYTALGMLDTLRSTDTSSIDGIMGIRSTSLYMNASAMIRSDENNPIWVKFKEVYNMIKKIDMERGR